MGRLLRRKPVQQRAVQLFGQVVAQLVGAVDAALHIGQFGVGGAGRAGLVLDVPEVEVGAVLAGDPAEPGVSSDSDSIAGMPRHWCVPGGVSFQSCSLTIASAESIGRPCAVCVVALQRLW